VLSQIFEDVFVSHSFFPPSLSSDVRSWEVAALAKRDCKSEAKKALDEAMRLARSVHPLSSRSEALYILLQAAFTIGETEARAVYSTLVESCPATAHWRCKRAIRDATKMIDGEIKPREFFR
jgi:hypothetical protein